MSPPQLRTEITHVQLRLLNNRHVHKRMRHTGILPISNLDSSLHKPLSIMHALIADRVTLGGGYEGITDPPYITLNGSRDEAWPALKFSLLRIALRR